MDIDWLEDFVELAAVRNFSLAATARNVTQPAFSRRIQSLEKWVGAELINRSTYPITLTEPGQLFLESCQNVTSTLFRARHTCRQAAQENARALNISALHTIALFKLPGLLNDLEESVGLISTRMFACDYHDCINALNHGRSDIAFIYSHFAVSSGLEGKAVEAITVAEDPFLLVQARDRDGTSVSQIDSNLTSRPTPLIAYSRECFLGKVQTQLIERVERSGTAFIITYESSISEAIKRMVIAGRGVGWVPQSAIVDELARGTIVSIGSDDHVTKLQVNALRRRNSGGELLERVWQTMAKRFVPKL